MKQSKKLRDRWRSITDTVIRFPITIFFLFAAMVNNAVAIILKNDDFVVELLATFLVGAFLYAALQVLYERFFDKSVIRMAFMGVTLAISIVYYLLIENTHREVELGIKSVVLMFALFIAFLWIPVIKSRYDFNGSFMAAFKASFTAVFFTGVLFLGVALIFGATNMLIFDIDENAYAHAANIVFVFLAPVYFFSLIPNYFGHRTESLQMNGITETNDKVEKEIMPQEGADHKEPDEILIEQSPQEEAIQKLTSPGKFLETLISFVIIPVTAIFTVILLLYIMLNITGDFWTDNLMEPLLISYSIVVIVVYLLAGTLKNAISKFFRMIFPKILVPVVLFQTISSILKIGETGITYGRYYVIMFGVFATVAGIIFCIVPARKNGMIAPVLIALAFISIVPPVDAFTVSRINQTERLMGALKRNDMFNGEKVIPNANTPEKDKKIIISAVQYLDLMDYSKNIKWLKEYDASYNFENTFGFSEYNYDKSNYRNVYINLERNSPIPVDGYDFMVYADMNGQGDKYEINNYTMNGKTYRLSLSGGEEQTLLLTEGGNELLRFPVSEIFNKYENYEGNTEVNIKELTFTAENEHASIKVIATNININEWDNGRNSNASVYILTNIK